MGDDTNTGQLSEVDQVVKQMADRAEENQPTTYNKLVDGALALGMTGMKPVKRFPSSEVGARRIAELRDAIKAFKSGDSAEHPTKGETTMKTSVKRKPAVKKTAKGKTAKTATRREIKSDNARANRPGILGEFKTFPGSFRDKLLTKLSSPLGKKNSYEDVLKAVFGNKSDDNRSKLGQLIGWFEFQIGRDKLSYTITREGRGDEATVTLTKGKGK
jgi:hypothetical protein